MLKRLASLANSVLPLWGRGATDYGRSTCAYKRWKRKAQSGELAFHVRDKWRPSENFGTRTAALFERFGFHPDQFAGKTVIDVGAGSKLRTKFFRNAELIVIEPLADQFRAEIPWSDVDEAKLIFSVPAEEYVAACEGRGDLIISINALDHCFDFVKIVENLARYMSANGTMFLSFDKHAKTDAMHPLSLNEAICQQVFAGCGLSMERTTTGFGTGWDGPPTYGHGPYAMNFWLRRAQAA